MSRLVLALLVCLTAALAVVSGELRAAKDPMAGSYIVVFKPRSAAVDRPRDRSAARGGARRRVSFVYQHALKGFAAHMTADRAAALSRDPRVAYVEADQVMHAFARRPRPRGGSTASTSATCR